MNRSDVCYITLHYLIIKLSYLPTFKSRSTFGQTFSLYHCWNKYSNYSNIRIAVEGSKDSDWPHLPLPQGWSLSPPTVRSTKCDASVFSVLFTEVRKKWDLKRNLNLNNRKYLINLILVFYFAQMLQKLGHLIKELPKK